MNQNPSHSVYTRYHDPNYDVYEIDLRQLVVTLIRGWKVIAGFLVVAVLLATFLNNFVLAPSFETWTVVAIPSSSSFADTDIKMNPQTFTEIVSSPPVMSLIRQRLGLDLSNEALEKKLKFKIEEGDLLRVTASGATANEAHALVTAWIVAVETHVIDTMTSNLREKLVRAEANLTARLDELMRAQDALDRFDQEYPIGFMNVRLSELQEQWVTYSATLAELKFTSIPADEASLTYLESALAKESVLLDTQVLSSAVEENSGRATSAVAASLLNPVYVQLNQELNQTQARLMANYASVQTLEERIMALEADINQLRAEIIEAETQRARIVESVEDAERHYKAAKSEWESALNAIRNTQEFFRINTVSPPELRLAPVAPRKTLNLALSTMLALFMGVFTVFALEWWRAVPGNSATHEAL